MEHTRKVPAMVDEKARKVSVRVVIKKMKEVNIISKKLTVLITLETRWREPELDGKSKQPEDWESFWDPKVYIQNTDEDPKEKFSEKKFESNEGGDAYVVERKTVLVSLEQDYNLRKFPFDRQTVHLILMTSRESHEVVLQEETETASKVCDYDMLDYRGVNCLEFEEDSWTDEATDKSHSKLTVTSYMCRKPKFWMLNFTLVLLILCGMIPLPCAFDPNEYAHFRLSMTYSMTIAVLLFKFSLQGALPKLPYLTLMDIYLLVSMSSNLLLAVWHATLNAFQDKVTRIRMDQMMLIIVGTLSITFHSCLFLAFYILYRLNRNYVIKKEQLYKEKWERMDGMKHQKSNGLATGEDMRLDLQLFKQRK